MVGSFPIPPSERSFPLMKWTMPHMDDTLEWLLWDGKRVTKRTRVLLPDEMDLPLVEVWNHDTLMARLAPDWTWTVATEYELSEAAAAALEVRDQ
jgi:hypothetical protein